MLPVLLLGVSAGLAIAVAVVVAVDRGAPWRLKACVVAVVCCGLAYSLVASPLRDGVPPQLRLPLRALAGLGAALHWSVVRQLFDGAFAPRAALRDPLVIWSAGMLAPMLVGAAWPALRGATTGVVVATATGLVVHPLWLMVAGRADDLDPFRRALRLVLALGSGGFVLLTLAVFLAGLRQAAPEAVAIVSIAIQALFKAFWLALTVGSPSALRRAYEASHEAAPSARHPLAPRPEAEEDVRGAHRQSVTRAQAQRHAEAVLHAMHAGRLYERPRLSIDDLATELRLPAHRVRAAINGTLGFRNFSAFVHHFRLREVARRLHDPAYDHLPISSIALDLGYGSLGPFNRAFRAAFDATPSAYRQGRGDADALRSLASPDGLGSERRLPPQREAPALVTRVAGHHPVAVGQMKPADPQAQASGSTQVPVHAGSDAEHAVVAQPAGREPSVEEEQAGPQVGVEPPST